MRKHGTKKGIGFLFLMLLLLFALCSSMLNITVSASAATDVQEKDVNNSSSSVVPKSEYNVEDVSKELLGTYQLRKANIYIISMIQLITFMWNLRMVVMRYSSSRRWK